MAPVDQLRDSASSLELNLNHSREVVIDNANQEDDVSPVLPSPIMMNRIVSPCL